MCEIITRSPVDGMRVLTHQPDLPVACLHPYFLSSMAAAQISRRNQKPANRAVLKSNGAKNSQDVREGRRRLPSRAPPQPLLLFPFPSKRSLMDLTLMENDCREKNVPPVLKTEQQFVSEPAAVYRRGCTSRINSTYSQFRTKQH